MKTLSRHPHNIKVKSTTPERLVSDAWYYEEPSGFDVVTELREPDGTWIGTAIHRIPKAAILRYARKVAGTHE